jgi:hypothetical protein
MLPADIALFGITLGCALIMLFKWKGRRMMNARRMNRGLRGYVSAKSPASTEDKQELTAA